MAGEQINDGNTAIESPAARATELKRAMVAALRIPKGETIYTGDDPAKRAKAVSYGELSTLVSNLTSPDALEIHGATLSSQFDTTMAAKSAMALAGLLYATEKHGVTDGSLATRYFSAGVTTGDEGAAKVVAAFLKKPEYKTRGANRQEGTVSREVLMKEMQDFFKNEFGMDYERAMVVRKASELTHAR